MSPERFPQYPRTKHLSSVPTGTGFPLKSGKVLPQRQITILSSGFKFILPQGVYYKPLEPTVKGHDGSYFYFKVKGKMFTFLEATDGFANAIHEAVNLYFNLVEESQHVVEAAWNDQKTREYLRKNVVTEIRGLQVNGQKDNGVLSYYMTYRTFMPNGDDFSASLHFSRFYPDTTAVKPYGLLVRLKDLIAERKVQSKKEAREIFKALKNGTISAYDLPLPIGFADNIAANVKYRLGR